MKIRDLMTQKVKTISPEETIQQAAHLMASLDTGALLVNEDDRLVGMITDRDITVRAVAKDLPNDTPVGRIMSTEIHYCFEDEDIMHVAENMAGIQMRRLPVLNRDKRLVGVVSLGNIARGQNQRASATLLQGVAQAH
ncbi:CBS domain-containing protein [Cellvibrio polysaccharolyticus]|uniref:CBS domain-containing protein n=1 Tax=Cellvibrio polysaccharolyticus TaxID=2082724 RepID=A0A928YTS8_9GAMM|nr:CBS domain-containing protein [Cellvibrio polysaccharolyticus]MBE8717881.1 CBS domain-containing protein [Cellvibrio polysaccharolyticus]